MKDILLVPISKKGTIIMQHSAFPFKTAFQTTLESKSQLPDFINLLHLLHHEGFYGIELNLPELDIIPPAELKALLNTHNLQMTMLATGAYAKKHQLSLSSNSPYERERAIEGCKLNINYASKMNCGIIIGFLKGGINNVSPNAEEYFINSIEKLKPYIIKKNVPVLIEVTNHKETTVINKLCDGAKIIDTLNCHLIHMLADTYHMNIEEPSITEALIKYMDYYPNLHISDNNRAFPGLGTLDFRLIYKTLYNHNYKGTLAVEGTIINNLLDDTKNSSDYLHKICYDTLLNSNTIQY